MKTIKILGTGCPKCKTTEAVVRKAIEEMGVEANVQKVEEIDKIIEDKGVTKDFNKII